jgi:glutamate N-acetyltransferase/amino-acid N-acetyltransferase
MSFRIIDDGHISTPQGFRATGISCGLKEIKARDLALIYSHRPAHAAAMFTTSPIVAAPIFFNQAVLARNHDAIRAVLINAGYANVATGQAGLASAIECAKLTADELEVPRDSVLLLSTGKIGTVLPMDRMRDGIRRAASELDSGGGRRAALAILTSDTRPKDRAYAVSLREGRSGTLAGMAKGSRMIHPRLATLLCILTTDLAISAQLLSRSLERSVTRSFGRLTIDGDSSPNDGVVVLANGMADAPPITDANSIEFGAWQEALDAICVDLAQQVTRDAAMGGKVVQVHVRGAASDSDARQAAQAIARSTSVRQACARSAPDWPALLVAVASSGVDLRPDLLELRLGPVLVLVEGVAVSFDQTAALQAISSSDVELIADLHLGTAQATIWTCVTAHES